MHGQVGAEDSSDMKVLRKQLIKDLRAVDTQLQRDSQAAENCPFAICGSYEVGNCTPKNTVHKNIRPEEGGIWKKQCLQKLTKGQKEAKQYSLKNDIPDRPEKGWYTGSRLSYSYMRADQPFQSGSFK